MKLTLFGCFLLLCCFLVSLVPAANAKQVIPLDQDNFAETTSSGGDWFIKFYAPWCGYCKHLAPIWIALAESVSDSDKNLNIAEVDCTTKVNSELCSEFEVDGYPTIKLLQDGTVKDYSGARTVAAFLDFYNSQH